MTTMRSRATHLPTGSGRRYAFALLTFLAVLCAISVFAMPAGASVELRVWANPAGGSTASETPTACPRSWTVASSPDPGASNELIGLAGVSSNDMWAVGGYSVQSQSGYHQYPLIEHGVGSIWTAITSTQVLTGGTLYDVAALSSNNAWAVGSVTDNGVLGDLLMHWDGTLWQSVPNPGQINGYSLSGIAALAPDDIWAVGSKGTGQALAMHWDGSSWVIVSVPGVPVLDKVVAISSNDVWAAGENTDSTMFTHWDGTQWSAVPGTFDGYTYGMAAVSTNNVWAVTTYYDTSTRRDHILHWDGTSWTESAMDNGRSLFGITATSASDVWAVGDNGVGGPGPLVKHWDGTSWNVVPTLGILPTSGRLFDAVAVSANELCAAGRQGNDDATLVARYATDCSTPTITPTSTHTATASVTPVPPTSTPASPTATGTPAGCTPAWSVVPSPNQTSEDYLHGVAAVSANDVWAVGNGNAGTLVEHWNGTAWSIVPSPNPATNNGGFWGVATLSAADVWAVGNYYVNGVSATLVEHWDGSAWSVVPSPNQGSGNNFLNSVAAISANDVWAVGNSAAGTMVDHWNGTAWSIAPSPAGHSYLLGIAAVSANDVWAVGYDHSTLVETLIEHWDGSAWSVVPSPNPGPSTKYLAAVAAVSANDVWAVGYDNAGSVQTLIEHWDGSAWSVVPSPNPGLSMHELYGVAAVSANDVWAVGSYQVNSPFQTLVEHWNGTAWSTVSSPSPGAQQNYLWGVAAVSTGDVWTVGAVGGSGAMTLVEHYGPCNPTATSTSGPTRTNTPEATNTRGATATNTPTGTVTHTSTASPATTPAETTASATVAASTTVTPTSALPTLTPTTCTLQFSDVPQGSTFYPYIRCLACRGIVSGYPDGTFRPGNNVTRGQLSKIVSNAAGFSDAQPTQMFEDVPVGSTFQVYIGRLASRGIMSGYACGGVGEPCGGGNLPYFRPNNNATRGQISKIVSNAAGYFEEVNTLMFEDVAVGSAFYTYTARLAERGIMGGYACGGAGEPCGSGNLPYFRPNNNATRGQTAKIVANTFFPDCQTRGGR